jgi:hypothetical protein
VYGICNWEVVSCDSMEEYSSRMFNGWWGEMATSGIVLLNGLVLIRDWVLPAIWAG